MSDKRRKLGFLASTFDLLHPGHLVAIQYCKENCDDLVVGLHTDPSVERPTKNKPIQSTFERWVQLRNILPNEYIIPYDTEKDLTNILSVYHFDVVFLGEEYKGTSFTGKEF